MPFLVADYSWTQTDSTVYISLPLKGAKVGNVNVLSTDEYLKVQYPPYLFEAFLFEPVDDARSTAKVGNGVVVVRLPKRTNKVWEDLMITGNDKEKIKKVRERVLLQYQVKLQSESRSLAEKQHAEKKYALETIMKLEKEEHDSIHRMKDTVREKATAELSEWQLKQKQKAEDAQLILQCQAHDQNKLKDMPENQEDGCSVGQKVKVDLKYNNEAKIKNKQADLPLPRLVGNIQVTFTPRVFPTALRESILPEEEEILQVISVKQHELNDADLEKQEKIETEWLKKQADVRHAVNADVDELKDLKEKERSLDWLKDKGDKCFLTGDYLGAVNVYNLAIKFNREIPSLYLNRAACHLKLRNLHKAIEDSSQALDLLTPPVAANAGARARASVRRGSAFCQLQLYSEGLQDYEAALMIEPHNEALQTDIHRIRAIIRATGMNPDRQ